MQSQFSTKPIFGLSGQGQTSGPSPFWVKPQTKSNKTKASLKLIWKWLKLGILIFFCTMGLWGCFQTSWDATVHTSRNIGEGIEFGFAYGQTGDIRYDLASDGAPGYYTFSGFSFDYGPFYGLFVYPGAWLATNIMWMGRNWWGGMNALLAIFLILLIIRSISITITMRSTLQNEKMSEVQGKIAEINAKYKGATDQYSRQRKSQETMEVYKKHKIKPFAAFEQMFITLPIFMIIYRVITIVRPIKATSLFNIWNFAYVPTTEIFSQFTHGGWMYIFFLLIVMPVQFLSMKLPQIWAKKRNKNATALSSAGNKQQKKTRLIQVVFMVVMCGMVAFSATGVGVYWFMSALFSIAQSFILHNVIMRNRRKGGSLEAKLEKLGLE